MLSVDDFMLWSFSVSAFTELTWVWTCPLVLCTCILTYRLSCIVCYWVTHPHTYAGSMMKTEVWQTDAWLSMLSVSWPAAVLRSLVGSEAGVCVRFSSAFGAEQDPVGLCCWMEVQQPALQSSLSEESAVNWKLCCFIYSLRFYIGVLKRWRHTGAVSWEELSVDGFLCITVT